MDYPKPTITLLRKFPSEKATTTTSSLCINHSLSGSPNTAPSSPIGVQSLRRKQQSLLAYSPPAVHVRNSRDLHFRSSPVQSPIADQRHSLSLNCTNSKSPTIPVNGLGTLNNNNNANEMPESAISNSSKIDDDLGQNIKPNTNTINVDSNKVIECTLKSPSSFENRSLQSELRKPRLDDLRSVDSSSNTNVSNLPNITVTSSSISPNNSQVWRNKLNNLKLSFLGSPRFHRKKSSLIHTNDYLINETSPNSPKSSGISQSQWKTSGRSAALEPSPL